MSVQKNGVLRTHVYENGECLSDIFDMFFHLKSELMHMSLNGGPPELICTNIVS